MPNSTHRVVKQLHNLINSVIWVGGGILTLVMIFTLGPILEGKYFPVTKDIQATFIKNDGDKMLFSVYGNKVRDCVLLDARVLVDINKHDNKPPVKGIIWPIDDGQGPSRRALGFQDLGIWAVVPIGDTATISAAYSCHPLWDTRVNLGTLFIAKDNHVEKDK